MYFDPAPPPETRLDWILCYGFEWLMVIGFLALVGRLIWISV